jgi:hypothetical protein
MRAQMYAEEAPSLRMKGQYETHVQSPLRCASCIKGILHTDMKLAGSSIFHTVIVHAPVTVLFFCPCSHLKQRSLTKPSTSTSNFH